MSIIHYCPDQTPAHGPGVSATLGMTRTSLCGRDIHPDHAATGRDFDAVKCKLCLRHMLRFSESAEEQATADAGACVTRPSDYLDRRAGDCVDDSVSHIAGLLVRLTAAGKACFVGMWLRVYAHTFKVRYKPTSVDAARLRLDSLVSGRAKVDLLRPAIIDLVQLLDTEGVLALATHLTERKY